MRPSNSANKARVVHRYMGFFLAGVMTMYAITGIVLVFRNTDFLKKEEAFAKTVAANLAPEQLGKALGIKRLRVERTSTDSIYFKGGAYSLTTGEAQWTKKELPKVLGAFTKLHKATTNSPLYWLNIGFGLGLLGFVVTSFWMYMPGGRILRKGLIFTAAGVLLVLVMLFV